MEKRKIEIMAPVGSYAALTAAIQGGADSVYFGVGKLNMRARSAKHFTIDDLSKICSIAHASSVKTYLTLNTIIYDEELSEMRSIVDAAKKSGITAIIASDIAVLEYAKSKNIELHISTQCNITNIEAVRFYSQYADVIVTARELSIDQVAAITKQIEKEQIFGPNGKLISVEVFAHGALCMAVSGKCYISLDNYNASANRGACYQPCRKGYQVQDLDKEIELKVDNKYIMSPKDLKTIDFLDKIINAGVTVLKIEGRGRGPEYVKCVTACYKEAADAVVSGSFNQELLERLNTKLKTVYNRDFWDGYYLGRKTGEWTETYGSQATTKKRHLGKVTNYFKQINVAEILLEANDLTIGDTIRIIGDTTGVVEQKVEEIRVNLLSKQKAATKELCSLKTDTIVRRGDKVYLIEHLDGTEK